MDDTHEQVTVHVQNGYPIQDAVCKACGPPEETGCRAAGDCSGEYRAVHSAEEMPPEALGDKFCRLDINMTVNKQRVNLEVQVAFEGDYPERVMLYWAREFSTALPAGQSYSMLPRTIIISIIDFNLFDCTEYHLFFQPLEVTRHTLLSDKMGQAINAYYTITASSEFREAERLREKARHDEAQALYHAKQEGIKKGIQQGVTEGKLEIARNLLKINLPLEQIIMVTGLTVTEIENLR